MARDPASLAGNFLGGLAAKVLAEALTSAGVRAHANGTVLRFDTPEPIAARAHAKGSRAKGKKRLPAVRDVMVLQGEVLPPVMKALPPGDIIDAEFTIIS